MTKYCLGFLFGPNDIVWLIRKQKPAWQKGRLNGIGGKVEEGEFPKDAMRREFKEEAGLDITSWSWFCSLMGNDYQVDCFYDFSNDTPETKTDETIVWENSKSLPDDVLPNLHWLIPMARSFEKGEKALGFIVTEYCP